MLRNGASFISIPISRRYRKSRSALIAAVSLVTVVIGVAAVWYLSPQFSVMPAMSVQPIEVVSSPVRMVILVDQSASISAEDMSREREAAALIALSEISPRPEISVVGFSSDDGIGRSPVDVVCPPAGISGRDERETLSSCVARLGSRGSSGTDYVAALKEALSLLGDGKDDEGQKLVYLLTDGKLDVASSPRYGPSPEVRNSNAQAALEQTVSEARGKGVQIWPIGFGSVDKTSLERLASGGYQRSCGSGNFPKATVVDSSADVMGAAASIFSESRCLRGNSVSFSNEVRYSVRVPYKAGNLAITVTGISSEAEVTFIDPNGREVGGSDRLQADIVGGGGGGGSGSVRLLRASSPIPGNWLVKLNWSGVGSMRHVGIVATWGP
ncbi:vWA domain-containing protein [Amycolatopsis sp. NPDC051061]|uniref:vWA domain-containing protein n=1 Tax=Amycolatopsis sp. NPDC051061 TaxID=3155042 RepID=UPI00343AE09F